MVTWLKHSIACLILAINQVSTFRTGNYISSNHTFDSLFWLILLLICWDRCHLIRRIRAARSSLKMGITSNLIASCCLKAQSLRRLRPLEAELMQFWSSCSTKRQTLLLQNSRQQQLMLASSGSLLPRITTIRLVNHLISGRTKIPHPWLCPLHSCEATRPHASRPSQVTSRTMLPSLEVLRKESSRSRRLVVKLRTAWLDQKSLFTVPQGWRYLLSRH